MTNHLNPDYEPHHAESPTASLLTELQLYGHRPFQDEPDARPLPEEHTVRTALADVFDALVSTLTDTRLEPDLEDLLWSTANLFHRAADRVERELDTNEQAQRRSQNDQDGSEIRSVELERLLAEGLTLIERRNAFEIMRDQAADLFETHTGTAWRPRTGSKVNHRALTAAVIDSRDFLAAKRRADTEVMVPPGPKVAFTGGYECNDHQAIWAALDRVHGKHPGMVLLHGGSPKGAERIAACWADNRKSHRLLSSPTSPGTGTPPRSSATTNCSTCCRSASWSFPAPASRTIWPTRPASSASRCSTSAREAGREPRRYAQRCTLADAVPPHIFDGTDRETRSRIDEKEGCTMVLGIIFGLFGIGVMIAITFLMAIFALPLSAALAAGQLASETGAGLLGTIAVGLVAGVATFAAGQIMLAVTRSTLVRIAIALAFATPAAIAGYGVVLDLTRIGGAYGVWPPIFAVTGAVIIGIAAVCRLSNPLVSTAATV